MTVLALLLLAQLPPQTVAIQCVPASAIRVDTVADVLFVDGDGDRWERHRVRATGELTVGFWQLRNGIFCIVGRGRIAPET